MDSSFPDIAAARAWASSLASSADSDCVWIVLNDALQVQSVGHLVALLASDGWNLEAGWGVENHTIGWVGGIACADAVEAIVRNGERSQAAVESRENVSQRFTRLIGCLLYYYFISAEFRGAQLRAS